jgi:23S rRNA pseudouridine2605 synthase
MRLNKALASAGIASRRAVEKIIVGGRVRVNGVKVLLPQTLVDVEKDIIEVDGEKIPLTVSKVYYLLNKPLGYVCTAAIDIKRRAIDLIESKGGLRLFTIGRLDKDTSGLILITNDGEYAHKVMHPSGGITKEYIAKVDKEITDSHLKALSLGCLVEGVRVTPLRVSKVRKATIRIVVGEGRHHEVRNLLEQIGCEVIELKRVRVGNLSLGKLPPGGYRSLTHDEAMAVFH